MPAGTPEMPRPAEDYEQMLTTLRQTVSLGRAAGTVEDLGEHERVMAGWMHGVAGNEAAFDGTESIFVVLTNADHAGGSYRVEASEYGAGNAFIAMSRTIFIERYSNADLVRHTSHALDRIRSQLSRTQFDRFEAMMIAEGQVTASERAAAETLENSHVDIDQAIAEAAAEGYSSPFMRILMKKLGNLSFGAFLRRRRERDNTGSDEPNNENGDDDDLHRPHDPGE